MTQLCIIKIGCTILATLLLINSSLITGNVFAHHEENNQPPEKVEIYLDNLQTIKAKHLNDGNNGQAEILITYVVIYEGHDARKIDSFRFKVKVEDGGEIKLTKRPVLTHKDCFPPEHVKLNAWIFETDWGERDDRNFDSIFRELEDMFERFVKKSPGNNPGLGDVQSFVGTSIELVGTLETEFDYDAVPDDVKKPIVKGIEENWKFSSFSHNLDGQIDSQTAELYINAFVKVKPDDNSGQCKTKDKKQKETSLLPEKSDKEYALADPMGKLQPGITEKRFQIPFSGPLENPTFDFGRRTLTFNTPQFQPIVPPPTTPPIDIPPSTPVIEVGPINPNLMSGQLTVADQLSRSLGYQQYLTQQGPVLQITPNTDTEQVSIGAQNGPVDLSGYQLLLPGQGTFAYGGQSIGSGSPTGTQTQAIPLGVGLSSTGENVLEITLYYEKIEAEFPYVLVGIMGGVGVGIFFGVFAALNRRKTSTIVK